MRQQNHQVYLSALSAFVMLKPKQLRNAIQNSPSIIIRQMMSKLTTITLILLVVAIHTGNLNTHQILRSLPPEFLQAELVTTPRYTLLKLRSGDQVKLLTVPDVYQFYNYSSGHSCLEGIFSYYQFPTDAVKYRQTMFIEDGDFDQNKFSSPEAVVGAAQRVLSWQDLPDRQDVFTLQIKQNLNQDDLLDLIARGIPPILLITKSKITKYGSYVIVIGHDQRNFYIEDPYKMGSIAYLPKDELDRLWYNNYSGIQTRHLAILIQFKDGHKPQEFPLVRPSP